MIRTGNLLDGTLEPLARTNKPEGQAIGHHNAYGNNRVVEGLRVNGIELWEDKRNRDEGYP